MSGTSARSCVRDYSGPERLVSHGIEAGPIELARRYGRQPSTVTMAVRSMEMEAEHNAEMGSRLKRFEEKIMSEK